MLSPHITVSASIPHRAFASAVLSEAAPAASLLSSRPFTLISPLYIHAMVLFPDEN